MRLRGLFDVISNLSSGQSGFWVPLHIYPRLHEVSGSLDTPSKCFFPVVSGSHGPSFKFINACTEFRSLPDPLANLFTGQ